MATLVDYGTQEQAMQAYLREGRARAMALGNRGPIRFTKDGELDPEIVEAYERCGFYVFEGVLSAAELADMEADLHEILDQLPTGPDAKTDRHGRPALGSDRNWPVALWSKPLGDPFGGTDQAQGRHPVKMFEPEPAADTPAEIAYLILAPLQYSDAALRLYGHPELLRVAAAINGEDFVPFNEAIIIKKPGEGASFAWHQDGVTHWQSPDWDPGTHGFNFMAQLYGCTAANGVWYVPGSHRLGKCDIKAMIAEAGTERLPQAVPMLCEPGDVAISNRQVIHGSFANTSADWRVTFNFGFHRRRSVLGATAFGIDGKPATYDAERIRKRSEAIGYGIAARRLRFPDEEPYVYRPQAEEGERYRSSQNPRAEIRDYNLLDLIL
jgi:ectoine hydroxylase-related dioxygenase (phytanoyl-CoA dioxygenase family)